MQCYCIDLYTEFSCLAGACPSTCCYGWKIVVDEEALLRFSLLENKFLKDDIFSNIQKKNGEYRFRNMSDGRCSMLDDDGLCRIQRNLTEKDLCNTCRKFPRLTGIIENQLWLSMAASCPVVANYLWNQKIQWVRKDAGESLEPVESDCFPVVQAGLAFYASQKAQMLKGVEEGDRLEGEEQLLWHAKKQWNRFSLFLDVVDGILELVTKFPEQSYLTEYLEYFGREEQKVLEIVKDMDAFEEVWQQRINDFITNYLSYRLFSYKLEYPQKNSRQICIQGLGELAVFYVITFSRYFENESLSEKKIIENINLTYRFCAHGKKLSKQVAEWFEILFEEKMEYIFLLQG